MSLELYNELRFNTLSNMDNRIVKQEDGRQRQYENLASVMSRFEAMIMSNSREKMLEASKYGHFYATLYGFNNTDLFEEFRIVFLLKGPYRSQHACGISYFEQKGLIPLITRLQNTFNPIDIYMKYDRQTKTHHIMASWKSGN